MPSPNSVASQGPGGFLNLLGGPTDPYYAQADGSSYPDAATACAAVPQAARRNRTVSIAGAEYWWLESDLTDVGLVLKATGGAAPTPGGGSLVFYKFSRDVTQAGSNTFDLPAGAVDVLPAVKVQQASTYPQRPVRILLDDHYRVAGGQLIISDAARLAIGDTVVGTAFAGGGAGGASRDNNNVAQSVQDAVSDASNLWDYGDLTTYGTTDLQDAALDGVVKGDYFDAFEQGSTTDAYRYCYCLQNDRTLGWTRLLKYS